MRDTPLDAGGVQATSGHRSAGMCCGGYAAGVQPAVPDGAITEDDWHAQMEEVVAMASIFGPDFRLVSCPGLSDNACLDLEAEHILELPCPHAHTTPLVCEALCHVDLPQQALQVVLSMQPSHAAAAAGGGADAADRDGGAEGAAGGADEVPVGAPVQFLPPIRLRTHLPPTYPGASAPAVQLHANWLSRQQALRLEAHMMALWAEQGPGSPILFVWLDWLRSDALPHLGIQARLTLRQPPLGAALPATQTGPIGSGDGGGGPCATASAVDGGCSADACRCALPSSGGTADADAEQVAMQLLRYHAVREEEAFRASTLRCSICFEDLPGSACTRLPECRHLFCTACVATHCQTQLEGGAVENLACPEPGCRRALPPHLVRELLGPEAFERWEELLLQRTLESMPDVGYCPLCEAVCIAGTQNCAQCPDCEYVFCSRCTGAWHPPSQPCVDPEQRLLATERRKRRTGKADPARDRDLMNQMLNLREVSATSKRCPSCKMAISKTEGCNKMTCSYCSALWCWRCERRIQGYDHFGAGSCVMFDQSEVDRWNRHAWQMAVRAQEVEQGRIRLLDVLLETGGGVVMVPCPVCGQANAKLLRNNLMTCYSCSQRYCAVCNARLHRKPGAHYGPGAACKQHT